MIGKQWVKTQIEYQSTQPMADNTHNTIIQLFCEQTKKKMLLRKQVGTPEDKICFEVTSA